MTDAVQGVNASSVQKWLTREYIEDKLQSLYQDANLKVANILIEPASAKGNNYLGIMTRLHVDYFATEAGEQNKHTASYIVKQSFEGDAYCAAILNPYKPFEKEMMMYENVLPKLTELLKEIGDEEKIFAKTIYVDHSYETLIFEDLSTLGYRLADRCLGLDLEHSKMAMRKLAKMHAAAAVLHERYPRVLQKFDYGMFNRHTQSLRSFFEQMFEECAKFLENADDSLRPYGPKVRALIPYIMEYGERDYEPSEGCFNTLTHGDFWVSNMLFKYDTESAQGIVPQNVVFIDFQFPSWSSPAVDLHYFFNNSLQEKVWLNNQEELVQHYHQVLTATLRQLKYTGMVPTLQDFNMQLKTRAFLGLISGFCTQPNMKNANTEDSDFNGLVGTNERALRYRRMLFTNAKIQKYLQKALPMFDEQGLFDIK